MEAIRLEILSPEATLVDVDVERVELPGTLGRFMVLRGHAPLISSLEQGEIVYWTAAGEQRVALRSGVVEVLDNKVSACIEP